MDVVQTILLGICVSFHSRYRKANIFSMLEHSDNLISWMSGEEFGRITDEQLSELCRLAFDARIKDATALRREGK